MHLVDEPIPGLKILKSTRRNDERGFFVELFRASLFGSIGVPSNFMQLIESQSVGCVRRGLHFQWNPPMAKLARISRGSARLVALDLRIDSKFFGNSHSIDLSEDDSIWYFAEYGFARGFETSGDKTNLEYLMTNEYNATGEGGVSSLDSSLKDCWINMSPIMSKRDLSLPTIEEWTKMPESKFLRVANF
jgi:dTDP-4-dehydrorhamnose 3,5-epimerase